MQRSNTIKTDNFKYSLIPVNESPLTLENDETTGGEIGLGFKARKTRNKFRKVIKFAIGFASVMFFVCILLAWNVFGHDNVYTVKRGESLHAVAKKINVPLTVLMNLNEIKDDRRLPEGTRLKIPTKHDIYFVKKDEKLFDVAKKYGVKHYLLSKYNRLFGTRTIKEGDPLFIPRELSDISITSNKSTGLVPFKVNFSIETDTRDLVRSYRWNMGNGDISHSQNPIYTYNKNGTYDVTLTIIDKNNKEISSNAIVMDVRKLDKIQFNAPKYIDVYNKGDIISLDAKVLDNLGDPVEFNYACKISGDPVLVAQIGKTDKFQITGTGYSKITIEAEGYSHTMYFFVSPVPAIQVTRNTMDWYKTQFNTGINGNCGPSCTSMAIGWAKGLDIPVSRIRDYVGLPIPDGSISLYSIQAALDNYGTRNKLITVNSPEEIFSIIDRGNIAIILINTAPVEIGEGNLKTNLYGRYYKDSAGHYLIVKGYTKDKKHFIVYDPLPADWWMNSFRYADGISMIGKNRFYSIKNTWPAIKAAVIEIFAN